MQGELAAKGALCAALAKRLAERDVQLACVERRMCRLEAAAHALPHPLQGPFSLDIEVVDHAQPDRLALPDSAEAGQDKAVAVRITLQEERADEALGQQPDEAAVVIEPAAPGGRPQMPDEAGSVPRTGVPSVPSSTAEALSLPAKAVRTEGSDPPAAAKAERDAVVRVLPPCGEVAAVLVPKNSGGAQRGSQSWLKLPRPSSSSGALAAWRQSPASAAAQDDIIKVASPLDKGLLGRRPNSVSGAARWRAASDAQAQLSALDRKLVSAGAKSSIGMGLRSASATLEVLTHQPSQFLCICLLCPPRSALRRQ